MIIGFAGPRVSIAGRMSLKTSTTDILDKSSSTKTGAILFCSTADDGIKHPGNEHIASRALNKKNYIIHLNSQT